MNRRNFLGTAAAVPLAPILFGELPPKKHDALSWQGVMSSEVNLFFEHGGRTTRYAHDTRMSWAELQKLYPTKPLSRDSFLDTDLSGCFRWHCIEGGVSRGGVWTPDSLELKLTGPRGSAYSPVDGMAFCDDALTSTVVTAYDARKVEKSPWDARKTAKLLWRAELIFRNLSLLRYPRYDVQTYSFDVKDKS